MPTDGAQSFSDRRPNPTEYRISSRQEFVAEKVLQCVAKMREVRWGSVER